jgi:hypothetical protein
VTTGVEEGRGLLTLPRTLSASPNPFTSSTTIRNSSLIPLHSSLCLYDAAGNLVRTLTAPGSGYAVLNGDGLKPGVYLMRTGTQSARLVKVTR